MLDGRPLLLCTVAAVAAVCRRVAVVCKPETRLPPLGPAVERWDEPSEPRHPLTGIVHALERAGGPVLTCAGDMPWVTPEVCRTLLEAAAGSGTAAAVAVGDGVMQPTLAVYRPEALPGLRAAPLDAPLTQTVETLDPLRVELPAACLRSVNEPADLRVAEMELVGVRWAHTALPRDDP